MNWILYFPFLWRYSSGIVTHLHDLVPYNKNFASVEEDQKVGDSTTWDVHFEHMLLLVMRKYMILSRSISLNNTKNNFFSCYSITAKNFTLRLTWLEDISYRWKQLFDVPWFKYALTIMNCYDFIIICMQLYDLYCYMIFFSLF